MFLTLLVLTDAASARYSPALQIRSRLPWIPSGLKSLPAIRPSSSTAANQPSEVETSNVHTNIMVAQTAGHTGHAVDAVGRLTRQPDSLESAGQCAQSNVFELRYGILKSKAAASYGSLPFLAASYVLIESESQVIDASDCVSAYPGTPGESPLRCAQFSGQPRVGLGTPNLKNSRCSGCRGASSRDTLKAPNVRPPPLGSSQSSKKLYISEGLIAWIDRRTDALLRLRGGEWNEHPGGHEKL